MNDQYGIRVLNRRSFLRTSTAFGGTAIIGPPWTSAWAAAPMLTIGTRTIEVNKKAVKIFSVVGANGRLA